MSAAPESHPCERAFHNEAGTEESSMKRRTPVRLIGVLAVLLAFAAALGVVGAAPAFADWESEAAATQQKELTGIVLKDLDTPVAGEKLDDTATAETDQGVTWEVPVVWCDLYGNEATVAEAGRTYVPTFAFIAPDGCTVKRATNGSFKLKLPEFLEKRFGYDKLVFIEDKATGVTFITFNVLQAAPSQPAVSSAATNAPAAAPEPVAEEAAEPTPEPAPEPAKDEVLLHCTPYAINRVGRDNLQELIDLIKNVIEPRAVAALAEAFPALAQAILVLRVRHQRRHAGRRRKELGGRGRLHLRRVFRADRIQIHLRRQHIHAVRAQGRQDGIQREPEEDAREHHHARGAPRSHGRLREDRHGVLRVRPAAG